MRASIQDIKEKFKAFIAEDVYFYSILLIVVSLLSFGLGKWSASGTVPNIKPQIILTEQPASVAVSQETNLISVAKEENDSRFVSSKKGTKYHLTSCPGAKQISEKNKIYFSSEEEAKASGYTRAKNCKF